MTRKNRHLLHYAREMRRAATPAERRVWRYLRTHPLGYKFRRQVPIGPFIVDFYCAQLKMILEIDGKHHERPDMHEYDDARTMEFYIHRLRVFRMTNDDVRDLQLMEQAIEWMIGQCARPPHPPSAPSPPTGGGEGS